MESKNKVALLLDTENYTAKPNKKEIGKINNRIIKNEVSITVEELSRQITYPHGKTWCPSIFKDNKSRKNNNWKAQQIFALDFDNGVPLQTLLDKLKSYGLDVTFAYTTFSHTEEIPKYRLVWLLKESITDKEERDLFQRALMFLLSDSDESCKDASRFFYGGKELIHKNYGYCLSSLNIDQLIAAYTLKKAARSSNKPREINTVAKRYKSVQTRRKYNNTIYSSHEYTINHRIEKRSFEEIEPILKSKIKIFADFSNDEWLYYPQLFGLATNLVFIKGGETWFKNKLKDSKHPYKEEYQYLTNIIRHYAKNYNYQPEKLENFSPYEEDHEYRNLLEAANLPRNTVRRLKPYKTMPLKYSETKLKREFDKALHDPDNNIYVIKKATGLGGTKLLESLTNVLIAFPNHHLKEDVAKRMKVNYITTPELPKDLPTDLEEQLNYYYSVGLYNQAINLIQDNLENVSSLQEYWDNTRKAYSSENTVLTTHTKSLFVNFENHDTLILDEDPLSNLLTIDKITVNDLVEVRDKIKNNSDRENLSKIINDVVSNSHPNCAYSFPSFVFEDLEAIEEVTAEVGARVDGQE